MSLQLVNCFGEATTLADVLADARNYPAGKFVVVEKEGMRYVCLFNSNIVHVRMANYLGLLSGIFVAAGRCTRGMVWYDSESCSTRYGYDRPKDPAEAEKLLQELKTLLLAE